jgi:hypothetical protein
MMKKIAPFADALALLTSSALAGDVSTSRAARMGLAGMRPMSKEQGSQIRGSGLAVAFGSATNGVVTRSYFKVGSTFAAGAKFTSTSGGGSVAYAR